MITLSDCWCDLPLCRPQYIFTSVYSWIERELSIRRYCNQAMGMKKRHSYCYIDYINLVVFNRVYNLQSTNRDTTRHDTMITQAATHDTKYDIKRTDRIEPD